MVSKRETATRKKSLQSRPVVKHTMLYEILKRGGLMNKLMSPTCCAHDSYGRISVSSLLQESRVLHPSRRGDPIVFGGIKRTRN